MRISKDNDNSFKTIIILRGVQAEFFALVYWFIRLLVYSFVVTTTIIKERLIIEVTDNRRKV